MCWRCSVSPWGRCSRTTPELQLAAVGHLRALAPQLLGLHDTGPVAEAIAALDHLLTTTQEPALLAAIDQTALALSDRALVERMVRRLGEPRVPPEERETLVAAGGAPRAARGAPGPSAVPPAPPRGAP